VNKYPDSAIIGFQQRQIKYCREDENRSLKVQRKKEVGPCSFDEASRLFLLHRKYFSDTVYFKYLIYCLKVGFMTYPSAPPLYLALAFSSINTTSTHIKFTLTHNLCGEMCF